MLNAFFAKQPSSKEIMERMAGYSVWMEIDLDAIGHNLKVVRDLTGAEVVPCVKKDAYAHGLQGITAYLITQGVSKFLVAKMLEARKIREAGLDCDVINMEPVFTHRQCKEAIENRITQVAYNEKTGTM